MLYIFTTMTQIKLLLKELRQRNSLSQEELAKALNTSRQSIISLERGEYLPSFPLLVSLIEFFNCPINELVEGINFEENEKIRKGGEIQMHLTPWNPYSALDQMKDEMDNLIEKSFNRVDFSNTLSSATGAMNIHEDDKSYEIELQLPGFTDEEINIEMTEDTLTVSGSRKIEQKESKKSLVRREWSHNEFSRSIRFSKPIIGDKVEAKLENGVLHIHALKVEPAKPKTTKVPIKKK